MEVKKVEPGSDLHLSLMMAEYGLNFVVGEDRAALLSWARDVWKASADTERETCAACVPTNWCDPMLTGSQNVIDGRTREAAVEAVLLAVKERISKRSNVE